MSILKVSVTKMPDWNDHSLTVRMLTTDIYPAMLWCRNNLKDGETFWKLAECCAERCSFPITAADVTFYFPDAESKECFKNNYKHSMSQLGNRQSDITIHQTEEPADQPRKIPYFLQLILWVVMTASMLVVAPAVLMLLK